jgi:hypothetical protein
VAKSLGVKATSVWVELADMGAVKVSARIRRNKEEQKVSLWAVRNIEKWVSAGEHERWEHWKDTF